MKAWSAEPPACICANWKFATSAARGVQGPAASSDAQALGRTVGMLVLSRKKNESIVINNDITIVVVEIRGDKVRLGIEAPKEIPVHRREVYDAIKRNEAVQGGTATPEAGSNTAAQS